MLIDTFFVHLVLASILFIIINWIGKHSYSLGYLSMSIYAEEDQAPAFNFVVRVLSPVVYLFITSAILYALKLDKYTEKYYLVSIYYVLIRLGINIITSRAPLINWNTQVLYWLSIIILSYFSYIKIIITKKNLLPDVSNLANELWIIICVFIYQIFNNIRTSSKKTIDRKNKYIKRNFLKFRKKYGDVISQKLINKKLIILAYSIIIYENFNRPPAVRLIENISFFLTKKPHTLGLMQVRTYIFINDFESVKLGVDKIYKDYIFYLKNGDYNESYNKDNSIIYDIIHKYNGGDSYFSEIEELSYIIRDKFFNGHTDKLIV